MYLLSLCWVLGSARVFATAPKYDRFPDDFLFGVGTSAYQIEGAWNISGKGESIWDRAVHTTSYIVDGGTGDVACDSYHNYQEDIRMLTKLKVNFYRFSISWTRIFPNGTVNVMNQDGVDYYNKLINGLRLAGIEPMVTLFHFDTPQTLQDMGGWTNDRMIVWFWEYADKVFSLFGDRVRVWTTINEPAIYCNHGHEMISAPFLNNSGIGSYLCGHNMIRAHVQVYKLYQKKYKSNQNGLVGITLDAFWYEPLNFNSTEDQKAAALALEFYFGMYVWPIFLTGDYPDSIKQKIAQRSTDQGFTHSRLPIFTAEEKESNVLSSDYLGLNHYATFLTTFAGQPASAIPTRANDVDVSLSLDPSWKFNSRALFTVQPESLRKLLLWITEHIGNNMTIAITENGYDGLETETLDDIERVQYINEYLQAVLDAMNRGANIKAYTWWSLIDNFEWSSAYRRKFGLYHVDFQQTKRQRTAKKSAMVYQHIIVTRKIDPTFNPKYFAH